MMGEAERGITVQDSQAKKDLIQEFDKDSWSDYTSGKLNNITDITLSIATVVASLIATILASIHETSPWIIAAVAAIPAACTSLQRIVGFRERSDWYFHHSDQVRDLVRELKYAKAPDLDEVVHRRGNIDDEMGITWRRRNNLASRPTGDS